MSIDYAYMNSVYPKQKAALTRAIHSGDPQKVEQACVIALAEWDRAGAWPDGWARWNIALLDATGRDLDTLDAERRRKTAAIRAELDTLATERTEAWAEFRAYLVGAVAAGLPQQVSDSIMTMVRGLVAEAKEGR